jgi:hypothetical protein
MQTSRVHIWLPSSLMLLAIPACGLLQPGQRLLHFEIEQDGKLAFSGIRGVPDYRAHRRAWIPRGAPGRGQVAAWEERTGISGRTYNRVKQELGL